MYFSKMKEKRQKAYRIESYDEILTEILISMFTYDKIPKELKESSKWTSLQAGTFIVFSNKTTNERFVAITRNTKSGLSLNRV